MSSNIPLINSTEDKIQDNIGNLQTDKQKASESYSENQLSKDKNKAWHRINYLHWINMGLLRKLKQNTH